MRPRYQVRSGNGRFLLWVVRSKAQIFQRALKLFRRGMSRYHDHAVLRCPWIVGARNFSDLALKRVKINRSQQAGTTGRDHRNLVITRKALRPVTSKHLARTSLPTMSIKTWKPHSAYFACRNPSSRSWSEFKGRYNVQEITKNNETAAKKVTVARRQRPHL